MGRHRGVTRASPPRCAEDAREPRWGQVTSRAIRQERISWAQPTCAVLRRGTDLATWPVGVPGPLGAAQRVMLILEFAAPLMLLVRSDRARVARVVFLPHCLAILSLVRWERLPEAGRRLRPASASGGRCRYGRSERRRRTDRARSGQPRASRFSGIGTDSHLIGGVLVVVHPQWSQVGRPGQFWSSLTAVTFSWNRGDGFVTAR